MAEDSLKFGHPKASVKSTVDHTTRNHPTTEWYRIGDLTVNVDAGAVKRAGQTVALSPLTFGLFLALIRRAPDTFRRQDLLDTVWPNEFVNDDTLSQRVRLLRKALGDVADEPRYVSSLRGWGYRIVPNVERIEDAAPAIRALAVLPLVNLSGDSQQEYFSDGMTESLISALARIGALKIISRTSSMRYKRFQRTLPQIGRELGVDAVIEGTVLLVGGRVRISVRLIRAATDERIWAETYDRQIEDVFALHADLATSIARQIQAVVTPAECERLHKTRPVDPVAYESQLRGRFFSARFTPQAVDRAMTCFEQAAARDPSFAHACAGLATACFGRAVPLCGDLSVSSQRSLLAKGKAAAKQALSFDDMLAEAHSALGMIVLFYDWDWKQAETELDRALELDSNSWLGHMFRGSLASTVLDRARTVAEMRCAIELDPLNPLLRSEAAECCYWVRDYAQAAAHAKEALELDASFSRAYFVLGRIAEAQGRIEEAISEYERAGVITGGADSALRAFQEGGDAGYHRWALEAGITATPHASGALCARPFFRARGLVRIGEADAAIECLEQAYQQRECLLVLLKAQEWWDPLRSDPRFVGLLRRIGIP